MVEYPGGDPGPAKVKETEEGITLSNKLFSITMQKLGEPGTKPKRVSDPLGGTKSVGGQVLEFMEMKLADGTKVFSGVASLFQISDKMWNSGVMEMEKLKVENLKAEPKSPQLSRCVPGKAVSALFIDNKTNDAYTVEVRLELRDENNRTDQPVDVDAEIDITLQPLEVLVLEGTNAMGK